jgi:hypothetical protein
MKNMIIFGVIALLAVIGGWAFTNGEAFPKQKVTDYKNATYVIEGQPITLVNGRAETPAVPGSSSTYVTEYFGNEAKGDLSGDGIADAAFIVTHLTGGSATFYYVVTALQDAQGSYVGTNGVMLGDRIAPQTTEIKDGVLVVNYADRRAGEPMTVPPSVGVSKQFTINEAKYLLESPQI